MTLCLPDSSGPDRLLTDWFASSVSASRLPATTKAYVVGVLAGMSTSATFGRHESIVLAYAEARARYDFIRFQRIGDWVLWVGVCYPGFIQQDRHIIETIGRRSYDACYRITGGSWVIYEELADELPAIVEELRNVRAG